MRLACVFLFSLLFTANAFAQSRLAIDKLDRKSINEASKEIPYSALLEGTVDNPDLMVRVLVYESGSTEPRSFPATVDETRIDPAGGYRWRAVCYFGEYSGRGVGMSYKVRVVAMDPKKIKDGADTFSTTSLQTDAIEFKRVRN
jgi:hypothetical protein